MAEKILVCTVGGSADPIVTAIRETRPSCVIFVCSSGERSSRSMVEGENGIAARSGLKPGAWKVFEVPPDEPTEIFVSCRHLLGELRRTNPQPEVIVDYTGGTKSMSLGLALAALTRETALQVTTGARADLVKVTGGTEHAVQVPVGLVYAEFAVDEAASAWSRYAYEDAARLLQPAYHAFLHAAAEDTRLRGRRDRVKRTLWAARMFAAWDRFAHGEARSLWLEERLDQLPGMPPYGKALEMLSAENREPLILLDLWHNALRRASRGRFDDALARLYRLVEWSAQYLLRTERGIETAAFDPAMLPEGELRSRLASRMNRRGRVPIGLFDAFAVLRQLLPDHPLAAALAVPFAGETPLHRLQQWIERRNHSILAHGFVPVDRDLWNQAEGWMQSHWLSWLQEELQKKGQDLPQFPTAFPA